MTTLAFDGVTLASDSQVTCGNTRTSVSEQKIFKLKDGRLLAVAGAVWACTAVRKMLDGEPFNDKPLTWDRTDFEGLLVNPDGTNPLEIYPDGVLVPVCVPWVGGSGYQYALAAMHLGFSAVEAVECAKALDVGTGGPIQQVRMEGK